MIDWLNKPVTIRRFNFWFVIVWLALVIPTVVFWRASVLWVAILSIWANVISHYTAYLAARVEVREERVEGHVTDIKETVNG